MATATLRTGDIVKFNVSDTDIMNTENWAFLSSEGMLLGAASREIARFYREKGERIAKIIKRTPKTVTVEISK